MDIAEGSTTADADFEALEASFRRQGFYEKRPLRVIFELAVNLVLVLGGIVVFVASDQPLARIAAMLASTYGLVGVASNSHTSSHHGTSDIWWLDESLTYLGFSFVFGVSTTYWKHHHLERHHPNTNVVGIDYDADLAPWFLLNQADIERSRGPARLYYRLQWLFFPIALALNLFGIQLSGLRFLLPALADRRRRRPSHWLDLGMIVLHVVCWLLLPMLFFAPGDVLALYVLRMALVGYGMFFVAAPAHYPAEAAYLAFDDAGGGGDYRLRQTATTINYRIGRLGYLLCSGADHQIEHHLFPEISHVHYRKMQPEIEAFCRRHAYPYRSLGWLEGIWKSYYTLISPKTVESWPPVEGNPSARA